MANSAFSNLSNSLTSGTVADADIMGIDDTDAVETKKITWGNIKAALKTYFDTLYTGISVPATTQSGTTYTIDSDDNNSTVILSNASAVTVTIPTDASDDLVDGYRVMLFSSGAGGVTLSTTGITLVGSSPNTTISQNEGMYLEKTSTANTWIVVGATAA